MRSPFAVPLVRAGEFKVLFWGVGEPTTTHESQKTTGKFRIRVLLRLTEGPKGQPGEFKVFPYCLPEGNRVFLSFYVLCLFGRESCFAKAMFPYRLPALAV